MRTSALVLSLAVLVPSLATRADLLVDFEDLTLPATGFDNGNPGNLQPGDEVESSFISRGAAFNNRFGIDGQYQYPYWDGWAISNVVDTTTPGFLNQYASYAGGGAAGSSNYGVAFGSSAHINLPTLGVETIGLSVEVTNTTYAALSMLNGDSFSKPFGGLAGGGGSVADYLLLTIIGYDDLNATGAVLGTQEFYLADYRFSDNSLDYIVKEWTTVDLVGLLGAKSLGFAFSTSPAMIDPIFGPTVPLYLALDNLRITVVPEPSSIALLVLGAGAMGLVLRRRDR